jgi:hypothetical protein
VMEVRPRCMGHCVQSVPTPHASPIRAPTMPHVMTSARMHSYVTVSHSGPVNGVRFCSRHACRMRTTVRPWHTVLTLDRVRRVRSGLGLRKLQLTRVHKKGTPSRSLLRAGFTSVCARMDSTELIPDADIRCSELTTSTYVH